MSDSDSESKFDQPEYIFYKDRVEWKDINPIPQNEGPNAVVKIAYSEKFVDIYDYFRAVFNKNEMSQRAFDLTTDAVSENPANYTVWQYRRRILKSLNKDLRPELDYITRVILDNPKNYQVWYHRQVLIEWLKDPTDEKDFVEDSLRDDSKNYHAWQYRHWLVHHFALWDGELKFTEHMIKRDLRNNSAWNYRYYIINGTTGFTPEVIKREEKFAKEYIEKAPSNESPWNYLRGLLLNETLHEHQSVVDFCDKLYEKNIKTNHLLAFMIDIKTSQLDEIFNFQVFKETCELLDLLANEIDTIRKKYWNFLKQTLTSKFQKYIDENNDL